MSDFLAALSSELAHGIFMDVIDGFSAEFTDDKRSGWLTFHYDVKCHFRHDPPNLPTITLNDDGTVTISNLKIFWDKLEMTIGLDIPTQNIGGFCLIWVPCKGCVLTAPVVPLFGNNPDISIPLKLDGFISSEITLTTGFKTEHVVNPNRSSSESDYDAHINKHASVWKLGFEPKDFGVIPIEMEDTISAYFNNVVNTALQNALSGWDQWAQDIIMTIVGGIEGLIENFLGILGEIAEWIVEHLGVVDGPLEILKKMILEHFQDKIWATITEDPRLILRPDTRKNTGPIMIPIAELNTTVNSNEIVIEGTLG